MSGDGASAQWTPDLIWVNSLQTYRTPNYYVQQLFSRNRGDVILPVKLDGIETSAAGIQNLYASATRDGQIGEIILKVVNPGANATEAQINFTGLSHVEYQARVITLAGNLADVDSMDEPSKISPVESTIKNAAKNFSYHFPPHSMTVLRIRAQ